VITSAAERCLATVRPYAAAAGAPVEVEPAFTVPADNTAPGALAAAGARRATEAPGALGRVIARPAAAATPTDEYAARRAAEIAVAGLPTLVCAHRENLPVLLEAACHALGALAPAGVPLPKGGFWVLQSADGVLVSAEQRLLVE
jgi:hypothetical protein